MARERIALARTFGKGRSGAAGLQSLVNLYAEPVEAEGRTDWVLYSTPAKSSFATIGGGTVRGQITANDVHYAVVGTSLYSVTSAGATTNLGTIEGSALVDMSFNGAQLDIVAELKSYTFDPTGPTLSEITDSDFEQASSVTNLGGYSVYSVKDEGRFRWSAFNNSASFDPLHFATAEAESDALVCVRKVGNEIALLGKETTEWWYLTGDIDSLFARVNAPAAEVGCVSRDSVRIVDSGLTWVGRDGKAGGVAVYRAEGYTPRKISTPEVDGYLESVSTLSNLHAMVYQSRGHLFYVLTNPNEWTLAWDVSTNQWAYRKSGSFAMGAEPAGGWDAVTFALNGSKQIVGASDGNLYELAADTNSESSMGIVREATSAQIYKGGRRTFMTRLELEIEAGVGDLTTTAPVVMASWSDDGGKTWSAPREAGMGAIGEYKWRAFWLACGSFRQRIIKFRVTDAVKVVMLSAHADMHVGAH